MGSKTKIDWCDSSWSPVTGCLHGCEYCYARGIARRFSGWDLTPGSWRFNSSGDKTYICLDTAFEKGADYHPYYGSVYESHGRKIADIKDAFGYKDKKATYPFGFLPTFHRYRLDEPQHWKKPRNIFVCSMADLFGEWVPDEWIKAVFEATNNAPQHNYIYLTKNPDRYCQLGEGDGAIIPDEGVSGWFGASAYTEEQAQPAYENRNCVWMSLEPIHGEFSEDFFSHTAMVGFGSFDEVRRWNWIVVGAETGNRKGKIIPKREWIENIVTSCRATDTPVFMKESLRELMGHDFVQEFPEDLRHE